MAWLCAIRWCGRFLEMVVICLTVVFKKYGRTHKLDTSSYWVRFLVFAADNIKMTGFWVYAPCSLAVYLCFSKHLWNVAEVQPVYVMLQIRTPKSTPLYCFKTLAWSCTPTSLNPAPSIFFSNVVNSVIESFHCRSIPMFFNNSLKYAAVLVSRNVTSFVKRQYQLVEAKNTINSRETVLYYKH